jgi:hypothetical protein
LAARSEAGVADAKRLRQELRDIGFYISDWQYGLDPAGFDALVNAGTIRVG